MVWHATAIVQRRGFIQVASLPFDWGLNPRAGQADVVQQKSAPFGMTEALAVPFYLVGVCFF